MSTNIHSDRTSRETSRARTPAPRRAWPAAVLCVALAAALGAAPSGATAATPLTDYTTNLARFESPRPQPSGQWAQRMRTVPDLDSDGANEILISDYRESFGGFSVAGRVYLQDGATRRIRYFIDSPEIQANAQFGFVPAVIGDVNGDGKADFVAGADGQDTLADGTPCTPPATGPLGTCHQDQGKAWVFSGVDGQTLYALNMPKPQGFARFGIWTGRAGDINGDGVQDIIVGGSTADVPAACGNGADGRRLAATAVPAGCHADEGEAYIFSGKASDHAAGASGLLRTLNLPAADQAPAPCGGTGSGVTPCGNFGLPVQGIGDATGDGVVDHQVDATSFNLDTATGTACATPAAASCNKGQGAVYLFSGATGALIRRTDDPVSQAGAQWGLQDGEPLAPGDVNGDGRADYFASGSQQVGPTGLAKGGRSWVFSGASGAILYELRDPTPTEGGQFGFSMSRTDYDGDGRPDLYVGQNPHHQAGTELDETGGTYVFSGRDGSLLKSLELPASDRQLGIIGNIGSNLGWASVAPGDLNGDGEPDFVAGAPFQDAGAALNCQSPAPGCVKDVGRAYFFLSNVPAAAPARGNDPPPGPPAPLGDAPPASPAAADDRAPRVTRYRATNTAFVAATGRRARRRGTTFAFGLSEPATVRIVVFQRRSGRRAGSRCAPPRRDLRRRERCVRILRRGVLAQAGNGGANRLAFTGALGARPLRPGTYSATITATDAARNTSEPQTLSFRVLAR